MRNYNYRKPLVQQAIYDVLVEFGEAGATARDIHRALQNKEGRGRRYDSVLNSLNRGTSAGVFRVVGKTDARQRVFRNSDRPRPSRTKTPRVIGANARRRSLEDLPPVGIAADDPGPPCTVRRIDAAGAIIYIQCSSLEAGLFEINWAGGEIVEFPLVRYPEPASPTG